MPWTHHGSLREWEELCKLGWILRRKGTSLRDKLVRIFGHNLVRIFGQKLDKRGKLWTGILWSWAGERWQDGYFYSGEGERKPCVNSKPNTSFDRRRGAQPYRVGSLHLPRPEGDTLYILMMSVFPQSGLKGEYSKGLLVRGQGVQIVGLRCKVGSKSQLTQVLFQKTGWSYPAASL